MAELKHYWLKTAKSFVLAADDFIVAVAETAKAGRDRVIEWAESENININTEGTEIPTEDATEAPVDEAAADEAPVEKTAAEPVAEEAEAPAEEAHKKA
ncbi:hypothetical protein [Ruminococcus difficilis]|uniref:Uncharacterized protein n=1 Tax=Ruminococcus difficilis TaxID=2763069 RepID=A0A934WPF4_9FIRM|nr:hypothetical protein [Ruminococcus difficilis]MBK6087846.1 hypothetical protein [Ruminococcus difficilis]